MKTLIEAYIKDHSNAWTQATLKSERSRLHSIESQVDSGGDGLWAYLDRLGMGRYSKVTYWTRLSHFYDWLVKNGHRTGNNPYKEWREKNARLFKHTYERKFPEISYSEAKRRIESLPDNGIREKCLQLLEGGFRYSESFTLADRHVTGKGGKRRRAFTERNPDYRSSYSTLARSLAGIGLKPHSLRKLAATRFRDLGLREEDLLKVMGWSSMETAKSYLKPKSDEDLDQLLKA
jgi:hypothetical protein